MLRFIHCADLHLGSPIVTLPPEKASIRRRELMDALANIVTIANERRADIILIAGDLFDSQSVSLDIAERTRNILSGTRAKIFISPGNHDYYMKNGVYEAVRWSDNVHIFKSELIQKINLDGVSVYGAAFVSAHCDKRLLEDFRADGKINIMVLHGDYLNRESRYNPISEREIADSNLDYLALGHVHTKSGTLRSGKTLFCYPGCPEGRGFDETGSKGVMMGEILDDSCRLSFIPSAKRRMRVFNVDLGGSDGDYNFDSLITEDISEDIVRIIFRGESSRLDVESISAALTGRAFHMEILDETRLKQDIWLGVRENTLKGLFLTEMRKLFDTARDDAERHHVELAVKFGISALERREPPA